MKSEIYRSDVLALGAGSTTSSYPVLYGFFTVDSVTALFKTEDAGVNWQMISDAAHGFGASSANVVGADISIYGRYEDTLMVLKT
jgi:xyloglucan-specific exo-beta-1,4-glucanase